MPVLLDRIHTMPTYGRGFANHIVGIASPPPASVEFLKPQPKTYSREEQYERGMGLSTMNSANVPPMEAVNRLKEITFASKKKNHQQRDNIKFIV